MGDLSAIQVENRDGVQVISFRRAEKKNAITVDMYRAMSAALRDGDASDAVRVHLFAGSEGCFTAGNDIQDLLNAGERSGFAAAAFGFLEQLVLTQKPMVAMVDGDAVGIGTTMLLHMDLVYASDNARFRTPFIDLGLVPEGGSSLLMPKVMGYVRAFEMLCLGKPMDSAAALRAGLLNDVLPSSALERVALENAKKLAEKPPAALREARALMRGDQDELLKRIHDEGELFMERMTSDEARTIFERFLSNR